MNSSNSDNSKKPNGTARIKIVITVFSLANILLLWNLFANNNFDTSVFSFLNLLFSSAQAPTNTALNDPPMPPLDPLPAIIQLKEIKLEAVSGQPKTAAQSSNVTGQPGASAQSMANLRVVSVPSIDTIVQKVTPKIEMIEAYSASASASPSGGGGHKTKSS